MHSAEMIAAVPKNLKGRARLNRSSEAQRTLDEVGMAVGTSKAEGGRDNQSEEGEGGEGEKEEETQSVSEEARKTKTAGLEAVQKHAALQKETQSPRRQPPLALPLSPSFRSPPPSPPPPPPPPPLLLLPLLRPRLSDSPMNYWEWSNAQYEKERAEREKREEEEKTVAEVADSANNPIRVRSLMKKQNTSFPKKKCHTGFLSTR